MTLTIFRNRISRNAESKAANRSWRRQSVCLNLGSKRKKRSTGADDASVLQPINKGAVAEMKNSAAAPVFGLENKKE